MTSVRRYYILLPAKSFAIEWSKLDKGTRRALIREHLMSVCEPTTVTKTCIQEVDKWLIDRDTSRERLAYHGRLLQQRYGRLCFICGRKITGDITVDHIFPYSKGGPTSTNNLILAHRECNSAKGNWIPGESLRWTPNPLSADSDGVGADLRYMIFLRDDFTCQRKKCANSLFTGKEIFLEKKSSTGLACYDNIRTVCIACHQPTKATNNATR